MASQPNDSRSALRASISMASSMALRSSGEITATGSPRKVSITLSPLRTLSTISPVCCFSSLVPTLYKISTPFRVGASPTVSSEHRCIARVSVEPDAAGSVGHGLQKTSPQQAAVASTRASKVAPMRARMSSAVKL